MATKASFETQPILPDTQMTDSSQTPKKPVPTYGQLRAISLRLLETLEREDHRTLLRELTENFDTAHLPLDFLNHVTATPQGALDPNAAGTRTASKDLLKFLYAPAPLDTLKIVGHFVAPHFKQLAPALLQEKNYLEKLRAQTSDYDLKVKLGQSRRQIDSLLLAADFARTRYQAALLFEAAARARFPAPNRIQVQPKQRPPEPPSTQ